MPPCPTAGPCTIVDVACWRRFCSSCASSWCSVLLQLASGAGMPHPLADAHQNCSVAFRRPCSLLRSLSGSALQELSRIVAQSCASSCHCRAGQWDRFWRSVCATTHSHGENMPHGTYARAQGAAAALRYSLCRGLCRRLLARSCGSEGRHGGLASRTGCCHFYQVLWKPLSISSRTERGARSESCLPE